MIYEILMIYHIYVFWMDIIVLLIRTGECTDYPIIKILKKAQIGYMIMRIISRKGGWAKAVEGILEGVKTEVRLSP